MNIWSVDRMFMCYYHYVMTKTKHFKTKTVSKLLWELSGFKLKLFHIILNPTVIHNPWLFGFKYIIISEELLDLNRNTHPTLTTIHVCFELSHTVKKEVGDSKDNIFINIMEIYAYETRHAGLPYHFKIVLSLLCYSSTYYFYVCYSLSLTSKSFNPSLYYIRTLYCNSSNHFTFVIHSHSHFRLLSYSLLLLPLAQYVSYFTLFSSYYVTTIFESLSIT